MYLDGRGPPAPLLRALGELRRPARPTLVVLDDADGLPADVEAALGDLIQALGKLSALVLLCARSPDDVGAHDTLVLEPLDAAAVRTIATDRGLPSDALLDAGEGVPRRVHQLATRQAQREAARRVDTAAARTAAGRAELSSREAELTGEVIALQTAQDRDAWGGDDETTVRCPFKGLAAFDVADAPYFFGRERLVAELVARLVGASLLGVVGPSGSGKSSVVRAGLLPALADGVLPGSAQWDRLIMRPGEHPLRELASVTTGRNGDHRVLLVIDQFEEVFTACRDEDERRAFVAAITAPDHGERAVMLAIRADHYGHCSAYPELSRLLAAHHVLVSAMRRDELRRAIERPALRAGLRVEPELTDALVADVEHEPGALPMLSTALLELWQRRDGRRLRLITYEATGGVRGSVARHAEEAFAQLDSGAADRRPQRAAAAGRGRRGRLDRAPPDRAVRARRRGRRGGRRAHGPAPAHDRRRLRGARPRSSVARVAAPARVAGRGRRGTASAPPARRRRTRLGRVGPGRRRPLPRSAPGDRAGMASPPRARPRPHRARVPGRRPQRRAGRTQSAGAGASPRPWPCWS